jgi:hypothetical protein
LKAIIFSLILILVILLSFYFKNNHQGYQSSRGEQLVNSISAKAAIAIEDKYNLRPCGAGVSMPEGPIREITLCFNTKHPYTKEQLSTLLIKAAHELLNQVIENEEIQEFIYESPFTIKNVQIIIFNHNENGSRVYDPGISGGEISDGVLTFRTVDKNDTFKFKNEFQETYEEALKTMKPI